MSSTATWSAAVFAPAPPGRSCFHDVAELAHCEIAAFRHRVLHVAVRLTRGARQTRLRIDKTWRWAAAIAAGFHRLRAAFS